jgi:hypothetical protein
MIQPPAKLEALRIPKRNKEGGCDVVDGGPVQYFNLVECVVLNNHSRANTVYQQSILRPKYTQLSGAAIDKANISGANHVSLLSEWPSPKIALMYRASASEFGK